MKNLRKGTFSLHLLYVKQYRTRTSNFLWSKSDLQKEKKNTENKFACRIYEDLKASIVAPCHYDEPNQLQIWPYFLRHRTKRLVWISLLKEARAQKKVTAPWILRATIRKRCRVMPTVTYFAFSIITKKLKRLENYWPVWLRYNILQLAILLLRSSHCTTKTNKQFLS